MKTIAIKDIKQGVRFYNDLHFVTDGKKVYFYTPFGFTESSLTRRDVKALKDRMSDFILTNHYFKARMYKIAYDLHTMIEYREDEDNGITFAYFETDKFGGTYAGIRFFHKTGIIDDSFTGEILTLDGLKAYVEKNMKEMLASRDMDAVCEMINSQYD